MHSINSGKFIKRNPQNYRKTQESSLERSHSLEAIELDIKKVKKEKRKAANMNSYETKFRQLRQKAQ